MVDGDHVYNYWIESVKDAYQRLFSFVGECRWGFAYASIISVLDSAGI